MKRYASVIKLKENKIDEYKKLHAEVWPDVLQILTNHHVKNYSIFCKDHWLFGYFEYHGQNYEADMKKIADHPITQHWWQYTKPCQEPLATRDEGEWWSSMQEVFHME